MINSIKCSGQVGLVLKNNILTSDKKFKVEVLNNTLIVSNASNSSISIDGISINNSFINNSNSSIVINGSQIIINGHNITNNDLSSESSDSEVEGLLEYDLKDNIDLSYISLSGQSALDIIDPMINLKNINLSGQSNLRIQELSSDIRISASGQSELDIYNINSKETTTVDSTGQSKVKLKDSNFNNLVIEASGMSTVKVKNSKINHLKESSTGMSKVSVK